MMVGVVTLIALFIDLLIDGSGASTWQFFTPSLRGIAAQAGHPVSWVGTILVMLVTALSGCRLVSQPASTLKNTRRAIGSPT